MDDWLMQKTAEGDREAFRLLVERHREHVLGLAYRFLDKREEAEDISQEVFWKLFQHSRDYKGQGQFRSYLARMTVHECLNRLRRQGRFPVVTLEDEENLAQAHDFPPDRLCEQKETYLMLQNVLEEIPLRQRLAFLMKIYGGLSYEEIGKNLGCSRTAVEGLIFRARQSLQRKLQPWVRNNAEAVYGM